MHGQDGQAAEPGGRWTARLLAAVLLGVEAVVMVETWHGLTGFAGLISIHGPDAWGVPVTLDGVSLVAALVALHAELMAEASGLYQFVLLMFTAASAVANYWHGRVTGSEAKAVYFGGMSIAAALVFALALRQIRHEDRRRAGRVTARLPKFSIAHWARYPRLTWTAWSLSVRDGHSTSRQALDAALLLRSISSPDAFAVADTASASDREVREQSPEAVADPGARAGSAQPDAHADTLSTATES